MRCTDAFCGKRVVESGCAGEIWREGGREGWREAAAALDVCICVCICVHTHTHTHTKHTHTHVTGLPCAPTAQKGAGKKLNAAVPNSTTKPAKFSQKKKVVYLVALQFV